MGFKRKKEKEHEEARQARKLWLAMDASKGHQTLSVYGCTEQEAGLEGIDGAIYILRLRRGICNREINEKQ